MKMNIKKLLVLGMLSLTLTGSAVTTSEVAQAKIYECGEEVMKAIEKENKNFAKKAMILKKGDEKSRKVYQIITSKIKKGKPFAIKSKSSDCISTIVSYYKCSDRSYRYKGYEVGIYDKKGINKAKKVVKKLEKNEKFTKEKIIPAVYDKYWELLEQGKSVKPMYWGDNGYSDLDISKYPAIGRCIQSGMRPEFNELSEVSQVHILTYFLRRYEFVDWSKKGKAKNSFLRKTDIERLTCYLSTVINDKNFNLNCETIYEYNELLIRQLGSFSEFRRTDNGGGHRWGTLTCKDFSGDNRLMECNNSGFYIAGAEDNGFIDDNTGESTHNAEDMLAYLNSELEYLGY